jgi:hypothetical protein
MSDADLLIKIRTILESQGLDEAKRKLDELAAKTNDFGKASTFAGDGLDDLRKQMADTSKRASELQRNTEAFSGTLSEASGHASMLWGILGKVTIWGVVTTAVATAVRAIRDFAAGLGAASVETNAVKAASDAAKAAVDNLHTSLERITRANLKSLRDQIKDVESGFAGALDKAQRLRTLGDMRDDATMAAQIAELDWKESRGEIKPFERAVLESQIRESTARKKLDREETSLLTDRGLYEKNMSSASAQERVLLDRQQSQRADFAASAKQLSGSDYLSEQEIAQLGSTENYEEGYKAILDALKRAQGELDSASNFYAESNAKTAISRLRDLANTAARLRDASLAVTQEAGRLAKEREDAAVKLEETNSKLDVMPTRKKEIDARFVALRQQAEQKRKEDQTQDENQVRAAKLDSLQYEFSRSSDPARLTALNKEILSLKLSGISETNPQAKQLRESVMTSESADALARRQQQIAVGFAEGALGREQQELFARPGDKKEQQDVVRAERDLENAKSGNRETITRLLTLIASMQADQKAIEQRLGNMEKREQVASGLN